MPMNLVSLFLSVIYFFFCSLKTGFTKISDWCELELFPNPMRNKNIKSLKPFIDPYDSVLVDIIALKTFTTYSRELLRAGPREEVVYNPKKVKVWHCARQKPSLHQVRSRKPVKDQPIRREQKHIEAV